MPKIVSYVILHYGLPYFKTAVAAIYPQVDEIIVLYSHKPSQGFFTNIPAPDTREELYESITPYLDKVRWIDGEWGNEGDHTDAVRAFTAGYDWLVRFDSDEVYQPDSVARLIQQAELTEAKIFRLPFLHFWRSFTKVCRDGHNPERIVRLTGGEGTAYLDSMNETNSVLHFGYAQPTKYIEYKMQVSGHKSEWRPEWFSQIWQTNAEKDVHPVCKFDFWTPEPFDKTKLPELLKSHPYYEKEVIE